MADASTVKMDNTFYKLGVVQANTFTLMQTNVYSSLLELKVGMRTHVV